MLENGMFLVDRYEILSQVGVGGMADVYKAKDHILSRIVAIKVLKAEFSTDINFVTKFRTEAQSAAGLEHPNIVNIYDVGSENGLHFIVMEYVEGITLKTYIEKKGQLSFKEATSIAIQVARGIEAAHNKEITHRDIKPQNIIISTEGKVKVTDFGIARAISSNTISSEVMGSVHYASPEQARNGFVDGRSDIYSLGIVMYEMVTGRVPFDGETTVAVAIQHLQNDMIAPSTYAQELPISYEKIVLKATQKSPERRYQTIGDLLADLRQALATPDEDFVVVAPVAMGDTRIINGSELEEIQNSIKEAEMEKDKENEKIEEMMEDEEFEDDELEDATGFLDPKVEKIVTVGGIVLAVIIVICVAFLAGSIIYDMMNFGGTQNSGSQNKTEISEESESDKDSETESQTEKVELVEMISILDMSKEEAKTRLEYLGLELNVVAYEVSDKADGTILQQSEPEGNMVEKGTVINVVVAGTNTNVERVEVPSVVGAEERDAYNTLTMAGFLVTKQYANSDEVAKGLVISQTPEGDKMVGRGTRVTIVISKGRESMDVPTDLVGKTEAEVVDALEALGFVANVVNQSSDGTYPKGTVFKVEGAGTKKPIGSVLIVYVSNDEVPETVMVPTGLVGKDAETVRRELEELGFVVSIETEVNEAPEDTVIRVDSEGTELEVGSTVVIYVSEGSGTSEAPSETPGDTEGDNGGNTGADEGTGLSDSEEA